MNIRKAYRYRLKPSKKQLNLFAQFSGCCRYVYNQGLADRKEVYEKEKRSLSYCDQTKRLTEWKKDSEKSWLNDVHSQVLQQSLKDLDCAFENSFRRLKTGEKPGFPRFKAKGDHEAFRYPQGMKVNGSHVYLPKIGWVRFKKSREIGGKIKQTTVIQEAGHWYVSFSCMEEIRAKEKVMPHPDRVVGIDVGITTFATLATGRQNEIIEIKNPKYLTARQKEIKRLQKHLLRKQKGSQNRLKCKRRLSKLHARVRFQRHNFVHQASTRIVKSHDVICVENLGIKGMIEKGSRGLSRAIGDASWGKFLSCLKYKAEERGKHILEVDRYYPSTKVCSGCGHVQEMCLSERVYVCERCDLKKGRDVNSALNIKAAGTSVINACGAARWSSDEARILSL